MLCQSCELMMPIPIGWLQNVGAQVFVNSTFSSYYTSQTRKKATVERRHRLHPRAIAIKRAYFPTHPFPSPKSVVHILPKFMTLVHQCDVVALRLS